MITKIKERSLPLAIGLNILLPGVGYMYMGKVVVGILALLLVLGAMAATSLSTLATTWVVMNLVMAIDMFILQGKQKAAIQTASTKKCPLCAETVQREAAACRFCGAELAAGAGQDIAGGSTPPPRAGA